MNPGPPSGSKDALPFSVIEYAGGVAAVEVNTVGLAAPAGSVAVTTGMGLASTTLYLTELLADTVAPSESVAVSTAVRSLAAVGSVTTGHQVEPLAVPVPTVVQFGLPAPLDSRAAEPETDVTELPDWSRKVTGLPDASRNDSVKLVTVAPNQRSSRVERRKVVGTLRCTEALTPEAVGESTLSRRGARLAVTRKPAPVVDQALSASFTPRKTWVPSNEL